MSDFPRGWSLNKLESQSGGTASVTAPATTGVSHVLTHIDAKIETGLQGAGDAQWGITVNCSTASLGTFLQLPLVASTVGAGASGVDTASWDGEISCPTGEALVVTFNGAGSAARSQNLTVQGHDI